MINNENQKSAFIAIVGRPNVGKSSILNRILGQKIAIVSSKPQTTRTRITGILTQGDTQLVFIDTPGMHKPKNELGKYMVRSVTESVAGVGTFHCKSHIHALLQCSQAPEPLRERLLCKVQPTPSGLFGITRPVLLRLLPQQCESAYALRFVLCK